VIVFKKPTIDTSWSVLWIEGDRPTLAGHIFVDFHVSFKPSGLILSEDELFTIASAMNYIDNGKIPENTI